MSNCDNCKSKCKANCCAIFPMPNRLFDELKPVRPIAKLFDFKDGTSAGITRSGYCPFLGYDLKCTIYDRRPVVCRLFGTDDDVIDLMCHYQDTNGIPRSKKVRRKLEIHTKKSAALIDRINDDTASRAEHDRIEERIAKHLPMLKAEQMENLEYYRNKQSRT